MKVMILVNDDLMLDLIRGFISNIIKNIACHRFYEDAISSFQVYSDYDLIIMGYTLITHVMNIYKTSEDFIEEAKTFNPNVKSILLTAYTDFKSDKFDAILQKPFEHNILIKTIKNVLKLDKKISIHKAVDLVNIKSYLLNTLIREHKLSGEIHTNEDDSWVDVESVKEYIKNKYKNGLISLGEKEKYILSLESI